MRVPFTLAVAAVIATAGLSPALAAGNARSGPTVGNCISDTFYGNEPNIVGPSAPGGPAEQEPGSQAGRVVGSQSPGPKITNSDGSVSPGLSVGDMGKIYNTRLPEHCRNKVGK